MRSNGGAQTSCAQTAALKCLEINRLHDLYVILPNGPTGHLERDKIKCVRLKVSMIKWLYELF